MTTQRCAKECACVSRLITTTLSLRAMRSRPCLEARKHKPDLIVLDLGLPGWRKSCRNGVAKSSPPFRSDSNHCRLGSRRSSEPGSRSQGRGEGLSSKKLGDDSEFLAVIRHALGEPALPYTSVVHELGMGNGFAGSRRTVVKAIRSELRAVGGRVNGSDIYLAAKPSSKSENEPTSTRNNYSNRNKWTASQNRLSGGLEWKDRKF
jgi:hypothetical protein